MDCKDTDIIRWILEPGKQGEILAVRCLMACKKQTLPVLRRMSLRDNEEGDSIFNLALAEFMIKVRQGKFELTEAARICTYIVSVARNIWLEMSKKRPPTIENMPEQGEQAPDEREDMMLEAFQHLDDSDREVLTAFYFYETSLDDYARQTGISHDAAKKRISRARERLKALLKPLLP